MDAECGIWFCLVAFVGVDLLILVYLLNSFFFFFVAVVAVRAGRGILFPARMVVG